MAHRQARWLLATIVASAAILGATRHAAALKIDPEGNINLSLRAYVNARISTTAKQSTRPGGQSEACVTTPNAYNCSFGGTYPYSGAGHLQQNRYFLELKWNHSLLKLFEDVLPTSVSEFKYNLSYRGEYDGIYDFGPKEYSHGQESLQELEQALRQGGYSTASAGSTNLKKRHRLRSVASNRNRLFQAFVDWEQGPVFVRFGRQNLVWGETDVFRLLDNINPVDNSFGGFFLELDERRVPLNMLRTSYNLGTIGPLDQAFVEGYVAFDNTVAFIPGAPAGSPWSNPLGPPIGTTLSVLHAPKNSIHNLRGGVRTVFNASDYTFTLASYQTRLDTQAVRFRGAKPDDPGYVPGVTVFTTDQFSPLVWVNGASMTTALPSLKSVLRTEVAWIKDESFYRGPREDKFPGKGLTLQFIDEFLVPVTRGTFDSVTRSDSFNMAVGWDMNQYIRALNPSQTFFISTQIFFKHIFDYDPLQGLPIPEPNNSNRVIAVPENQVLQTLAISTTYNAKVPFTDSNMQVSPGYNMFYDWQGMLLFQPGVRFVRDPWRFIVDYTTINSGVYRASLGVVRDRSNVRFQVEYVL